VLTTPVESLPAKERLIIFEGWMPGISGPAMFALFQLTMLLAAATWAATAPTKSKWLRVYFGTHIICYAALLAYEFDPFSRRYFSLFPVLTFCILVASAGYAFEFFEERGKVIRWIAGIEAIALPAFLINLAIWTWHPHLTELWGSVRIALGQSGALLALGIGLGTVSLLTPRSYTARILALLWLLLGAWGYVSAIGFAYAEGIFQNLSEWLPVLLVIVAFGLIGFTARRMGAIAQCRG